MIERKRIDQEVHQMFDTPENITTMMNEAPTNPVPALKWAQLAGATGDGFEVIRRARVVVERFPKLFQPHYNLAAALFYHSDDQAGAYRILRRLARRWPKDLGLMDLLIAFSRHQSDWQKVERLGDRYRKWHPTIINGYAAQIDALLRLDNLDGAERILLLADIEFPDSQEIAKLWDRLEEQLAASRSETMSATPG